MLHFSKWPTNLFFLKRDFFKALCSLVNRCLHKHPSHLQTGRPRAERDSTLPKVSVLLPFSCFPGLNPLEANRALLCYCQHTVPRDNAARRHYESIKTAFKIYSLEGICILIMQLFLISIGSSVNKTPKSCAPVADGSYFRQSNFFLYTYW